MLHQLAAQQEEQEFEPEPWVDLAISSAQTISEGLESSAEQEIYNWAGECMLNNSESQYYG